MENQNQNINQSKYLRASDRVAELKQFYTRCFRGVVAILIVAAINYYLNEWRYPWFLWVVFGVGLSLAIRAFKVYGSTALWAVTGKSVKSNSLWTRTVSSP